MKNTIAVLLTLVTIVAVMFSNHFKEKSVIVSEKLSNQSKLFVDALALTKANQWIDKNIVPTVEKFGDMNSAESELIFMQENIKEMFHTDIKEIDKSKKGVLSVEINSKIPRDNIVRLLHLYKFNMQGGYVKINSVAVDANYVYTNFDLMKFYKE